MYKCLYICQYTYRYILTTIEVSVHTLHKFKCTCLYTCHYEHFGGALSGERGLMFFIEGSSAYLDGLQLKDGHKL